MPASGALILALWLAAGTPDAVDAPFSTAAFAPPDVSLFVQIEDAAALRREIADRPMADGLKAVMGRGQIQQAWSSLAKMAGADEARLFDASLGRRVTFLKRGAEWVIVTEMNEQASARLMQSLKVRVREPRAGMAIAELPEQEMLLARGQGVLVAGPSSQSRLFLEVLPRLEQQGDSLSTLEPFAITKNLGPGRIGIFIRHDPPLGGHSAIVADLHGGAVRLRLAGKFENAPINRTVTQLTCDFSPVLRFEDRALLAYMQPTDVSDSPVETFLAANLGEPFVSAPMRRNLGDRRLVVIGEVEGRQLERPVDLLSTTFVTCVQLKEPEHAIEQLDEQMIRIARRIRQKGEGSFLVKMPRVSCMRADEPREIDLSAASDWFTGGFPIMKNVTLSWTVADSPEGAWFVVGSHRQSLDDVVRTLQHEKEPAGDAEKRDQEKFIGKFASCGVGNGGRISRHVQSWVNQAEAFAEEGRADELRATLRMFADVASGMKTGRWQLVRPSPNEMRLDVQVELAPPRSSRPGD